MVTLDSRYSLALFSLFDYERVEHHLEKMASKGWKIEKSGSFLWKFKREMPQNKKYVVVFSKDTSDYDPFPSERQNILRSMSEEEGWIKEAEWKQMHIFSCTDMNQELVTDEFTRLYSIRHAMKKTYIPCWTIVLVGLLLLALENVIKLHFGNTPDQYDALWVIAIAICGAFAAATILTSYYIWVLLSEKAIERGCTCKSTKWSTIFQYLICAVVFVLAGCYLLWKNNLSIIVNTIYTVAYLLMMVAIVFFTSIFTDYLRKKKVTKTINIVCSGILFVCLLLLGIALASLIGTII